MPTYAGSLAGSAWKIRVSASGGNPGCAWLRASVTGLPNTTPGVLALLRAARAFPCRPSARARSPPCARAAAGSRPSPRRTDAAPPACTRRCAPPSACSARPRSLRCCASPAATPGEQRLHELGDCPAPAPAPARASTSGVVSHLEIERLGAPAAANRPARRRGSGTGRRPRRTSAPPSAASGPASICAFTSSKDCVFAGVIAVHLDDVPAEIGLHRPDDVARPSPRRPRPRTASPSSRARTHAEIAALRRRARILRILLRELGELRRVRLRLRGEHPRPSSSPPPFRRRWRPA